MGEGREGERGLGRREKEREERMDRGEVKERE